MISDLAIALATTCIPLNIAALMLEHTSEMGIVTFVASAAWLVAMFAALRIIRRLLPPTN